MEIGELVSKTIELKETCWYCKEQPKTKKLFHDENADPETSNSEQVSTIPENKEGNDSSKLGKALIANKEKEPTWSIENPLKPGSLTKIVPAAHHCIPGEASLAQAGTLHKFMREGGPYAFETAIGYNVNSADNGVWLPGNYAVRDDNPDFGKKTWTAHPRAFQMSYVRSAMTQAEGKMFHDAHRKYNGLVLDALEMIASKLVAPDKEKCPICNAPLNDNKRRPPYGLVGRLNCLSGEYRGVLQAPTKATVQAGYFTSSKARDVINPPILAVV